MSDMASVGASLFCIAIFGAVAISGCRGVAKTTMVLRSYRKLGILSNGRISAVAGDGEPTVTFIHGDTIRSFSSRDSYFDSSDIGSDVPIWHDPSGANKPRIVSDDLLLLKVGLFIAVGGLAATIVSLYSLLSVI